MITKQKLGPDGRPVVGDSDEQLDTTTAASTGLREAALGQLKDKLLGTVAPPKQEDPIVKVKRLMKAGVPNPLQTALAQKGM